MIPTIEPKIPAMGPATEKILNLAVDAVTNGFESAMEMESTDFAYLVPTPEAKELIKAFFDSLK